MILFAVDPSVRAPGVALFRDGRLIACAALKVKPGRERADRCAEVVGHVFAWLGDHVDDTDECVDVLAVEWPQVYRAGKSKGDPNDLFGLAGICGALAAGMLIAHEDGDPPTEVRSYLPGEWCRLPKVKAHAEAFTSVRGSRIMSRLDDAERALVPQSHDAVDAVGIGLHALGRLAPRRVLPGATPG